MRPEEKRRSHIRSRMEVWNKDRQEIEGGVGGAKPARAVKIAMKSAVLTLRAKGKH